MEFDSFLREYLSFIGIKVDMDAAGFFRKKWNEFLVQEVLHRKVARFFGKIPDRLKPGKYTAVLVKKRIDHFTALHRIAKTLGINVRNIKYCGIKDTVAATSQFISFQVDSEICIRENSRRVYIHSIEPCSESIYIGEHDGNIFTVKIYGSYKLCDNPLNFYGPQRFGVYRPNNHIVGYYLVTGDYEKAFKEAVFSVYFEGRKISEKRKYAAEIDPKEALKELSCPYFWVERILLRGYLRKRDYRKAFLFLPKSIRRMYLHAFQAYVFNLTLSIFPEVEKIQLAGRKCRDERTLYVLEQLGLKPETLNRRILGIRMRAIFRSTRMKYRFIYKGRKYLKFFLRPDQYATTFLLQHGVVDYTVYRAFENSLNNSTYEVLSLKKLSNLI